MQGRSNRAGNPGNCPEPQTERAQRVHSFIHTFIPSFIHHTLLKVILFHSIDEVRSGVKVVWSWLLEPPQTKETLFIGCAAGKSSSAGDTGITCPALGLQVKGLQSCDRHLSLTTAFQQQETKDRDKTKH